MGLSPLGQYFNSVAQEYKRSFGPPQRIPRAVFGIFYWHAQKSFQWQTNWKPTFYWSTTSGFAAGSILVFVIKNVSCHQSYCSQYQMKWNRLKWLPRWSCFCVQETTVAWRNDDMIHIKWRNIWTIISKEQILKSSENFKHMLMKSFTYNFHV